MDNRYPYPPSEALQPPGVSNNYPQSSYNAGRPLFNNMNANASNSAAPGGNYASNWNTSPMYYPSPTLSNQQNFQNPPMPQLHPYNQAEPPPPIGFPPPSGFSPPPGIHPPSAPGLPPPPCLHPPPGPGLSQPTGLQSSYGPGIPEPTRHPPPAGLHPPPGPGYTHPTGSHASPCSGFTQPTCHPPPSGLHPLPGSAFTQPTELHSSLGPGPPQATHHPAPSEFHPPPGPSPPFTRPNHGFGCGAQLSTQRQVHPEVSGMMPNFFRDKDMFVEPEDETTIQRRADDKWVKQFLGSKRKLIKNDRIPQSNKVSISDMKNALYSTAQLLSQLSTLCENMELNLDDQNEWSNSYEKALKMKQNIQDRLNVLKDNEHLERVKTKLSNVAKKRARRRRARQQLQIEEQQREAQNADKDVAIEKWRQKQIHAEEEKKKERELKLAADAVLCEVRKKLADVKRMQNILKSLEKLRKLRKEAASRKGIFADPQSEETFNGLLEKLRDVAKKRTVVYSAEEKALMVMVEGEQEEERRRDLEKRRQKERDKQLNKKRKIDCMLFGDETPADPLMQAFRQYYTQAEHSLPALVQIRREWDVFLVPVDHPEGSAVPQGWVIPDAPSDQVWASALQSSECEAV